MKKKTNRNAQGAGSIRQRPDGRFEARYTTGRDPGTGKQIQKSIYGSTQAEVLKKLQAVQVDIERGTFTEPSKMTCGAWLDIWQGEYLGGVKKNTGATYRGYIKQHIRPAFAEIKLQKLKPHQIQQFYNGLQAAGLSSKTIRNIHGVLHSALEQAVDLDYIKQNPSEKAVLPRWIKKDIKVMDDVLMGAFFEAIQGDRLESIFFVDLLTGLRQSEILGLSWDCIDFDKGIITVAKQLVRDRTQGSTFYLDTTKNDRIRTIRPAPVVMQKLKERQRQQIEHRLMAGAAWCNEWNLVFTDELGHHLSHKTAYRRYKAIVAEIGHPDLRFHDMRHSYAVAALRAGDDVKVLQQTLGHHTAAFTLDTYAHVTEQMQTESANKMQQYIERIQKA